MAILVVQMIGGSEQEGNLYVRVKDPRRNGWLRDDVLISRVKSMLVKPTALATLGIFLLVFHCNSSIDMTVENRTNEVIFAEVNNEFGDREIKPGKTRTFSFIAEREQFHIVARNESGQVLLDQVLSREELKAMGNEIVITQPESPQGFHLGRSRGSSSLQ